MDEKRRFSRVSFREAVQYRLAEESALSGAVTIDLSEGGLKFWANEFLPLASNVIVNFCCKAERLLTLEGTVAWVQKLPFAESYLIGCRFSENRDNIYPKAMIQNFVQTRGPSPDHGF